MKKKLCIQLAIIVFFICFGTAAWAGGVIASAETKTGAFSAPSYQDAWTFSGTAGDRVVITASGTTSGVHPEIYLYPPGGGPSEASVTGFGDWKRLDHQIEATGTYTILAQEYGQDNTGGYGISLAKIPGALTSPSDADGGAIVSAQTLAGTLSPASDTDLLQFSATAGDRVVITASGTTSGVHPEIYLYPPGGGPSEASVTGFGDWKRLDHQIEAAGTYTILVQEYGQDNTGGYGISLAKIPGALTSPSDADGGAIVSAQTLTGTLTPASDTDLLQFSATAGDRVVITASGTTSGVHPEIYLYPPGGGPSEASVTGFGDWKRLDHQIEAAGIYTILVQEYGQDNTGGYGISLAKIPGALTSPSDADGGAIVSAQTLTGTLTPASDTDLLQFSATAGDRVVITASGTTSGVHPEIYLYPPGGGPSEASVTGFGDAKRLDHQIETTGTYTILLQEYGQDNTGVFGISLQKIPSTPGVWVYNLFPYEGISTEDFIGYLSWDPVPGATGYDVYFGENVIAPLVKIGENIPSPFLAFPDMVPLTVYYWQVVAHTPSGDIPGPIQWFKTGVLDCEGDFGNSGSVDADDLAQFASAFGRDDCGSGPLCTGDFDADMDVDGADIVNFIKDYNRIDCPAVEMAESFDGPPTGWTDDGSGTWSTAGGVYRMIGTMPAGGAFRFSYYGNTFFDFTFQADITKAQGGLNTGGGLLFRGDGTLDNVYVFQIVPNGNYFIGKRVGGTPYTLIPSTYSSVINTGLNAVNTLRVACHGAIMQFYINDKLVNVVEDEAFDSGRVGLYAWDDPSVATDVHFDDAEVFSISIP